MWRVEAKEPKDDDDAPLVPAANGAEASRARSRSKLARFASTLAPGELRAAEEAFVAAQIRAQGEASTAARAAGLDAPAPAAELPALMRAMGYYPTEREVAEMRAELRAEAERRARRDDDENGGEKEGGEGGGATVRFDRFLAMYVNRKPAGVGASFGAASDAAVEAATRRAFAALGVGEGDAIDRASLVAALASGGEPMTREELDAAAAAILGPGATAEDLIPETVDAAEFARGVLGVGGADEIEASA